MKKIDDNVLFYLRGDSFLDLAPNPVTNIVNKGSVSVDVSKDYAFYFNGTSQALTINIPGANFSSVLSQNYTIEYEAMQVSINQTYPTPFAIVNGNGGSTNQRSLYSHWMTSSVISFYDSTTPSTPIEYRSHSLNKWHHIARVREGNTLKTYVDGKLLYTNTSAQNIYTASDYAYIGAMAYATTATLFNGYVRNIKFSNKALYTGEFTPTFEKYTSISIDNVKFTNNVLHFEVNKLSPNESILGVDVKINGKQVTSYNTTGSYDYVIDNTICNKTNDVEITVRLFGSETITENVTYIKPNVEFIYKDEPTLTSNIVSYLRGDSYTDLAINAGGRNATNYSTTLATGENYGIEMGTSTGYLTMANGTSDINWGGNFTIEWSEYSTGSGERNCGLFLNRVSTAANNGGLLLSYANGTQIYTGNSTSWNGFSGTPCKTKTDNMWVHWRLVKNGTTWTMYKDGVQYWTSTSSVVPKTVDGGYSLGAWYDSTGIHSGYAAIIRDFAISNTALCTGNFTPPTKPYTSVSINMVDYEDGIITASLDKTSVESVSKVEYHVNNVLVRTFTNNVTTTEHDIGVLPYGRNKIEVRAYYCNNYYVSYIVNYVSTEIDKLNTTSSYDEINDKLLELHGIFKSLSKQLADILIDKNIPVEESEKKLFLLIEKVRYLKPLD